MHICFLEFTAKLLIMFEKCTFHQKQRILFLSVNAFLLSVLHLKLFHVSLSSLFYCKPTVITCKSALITQIASILKITTSPNALLKKIEIKSCL